MGNMSYCRFENTSRDLSDCIEALQYGEGPSSESEVRSARSMFNEFLQFCEDEGIIDSFEPKRLNSLFPKEVEGR